MSTHNIYYYEEISKIIPKLSTNIIKYPSYLIHICVSGEMVFSVLGQTEIYGVKNITSSIQEGLRELGTQSDVGSLE